MARDLSTGESLVGEHPEIAHVGLVLGSKTGPVGQAFAAALVNQTAGHTVLFAVVTPNLPAKPDTLITNKNTINSVKQGRQLTFPAQFAVSRAVVDAVQEGIIPRDEVDDLVIIVSVYIHRDAEDDQKIFDYNYKAMKEALARAINGEPTIETVLADTPAAHHPYAARAEP